MPGLTLARFLSFEVSARLILVSRTELPRRETWEQWVAGHGDEDPVSRILLRLLELEAAGSEIFLIAADVSDFTLMSSAVKRARKHFGRIDGIIHAASVSEARMIREQTVNDSDPHFKAKVDGTLNLAKLAEVDPPDFVVLCSSLEAVLTPPGEVASSAANAFLDAFSHSVSASAPTRWITIDWDNWQEKGMDVQAVEVFKRIIAMEWDIPRVIVSSRDLHRLLEAVEVLDDIRSDPEIEMETLSRPMQPRPQLDNDYVAPSSPSEERIATIWQNFLGIEKVGVTDDFFELGGDSLKGMTISARMYKTLDVEIPLMEFFNSPTVASLAQYVDNAGGETGSGLEYLEEREYYPLSSAQKRLFVLNQVAPESIVYNIFEFTIFRYEEGNFDPAKVEETWRRLILRHESLRTAFVEIDGEPVQFIRDEVEFHLEYHDMSNIDEDIMTVVPAVRDTFVRPFDLGRPPLMRAGLIRLPGHQYTWMLDIHHIISDGTSQAVLMRDFMALYLDQPLPHMPFQYKEFTAWQNRLVESGDIRAQEAHWMEQFPEGGNVPRLSLPADFPRPGGVSFEGGNYSFQLDEEKTAQLKQMAAKYGTTLYMNLLTILNILLFKYTHQQDIIVGSGIMGRRHADLENIVGHVCQYASHAQFPRP